MDILVVGSGGREHALCWKIEQSPLVEKVYCAPGNAGISKNAECVDISVSDLDALVKFAKEKVIGLTVVGPELPLTMGIANQFEKEGLKVFGPSRGASLLEGSKVFSKNFMKKYSIPTAAYNSFNSIDSALEYIENLTSSFVVKADGLAAGKGVIICNDVQEGREAINSIMSERVFGEAGSNIVIEEYLEGEEASIFVLTDGDKFISLLPSQDHKPIYDGDKGPNTGGMGAYCPAPIVDDELMNKTVSEIIIPTIEGLKAEGRKYKGVLYIGLMINEKDIKVLEYNCRFGDPEAQPVLMNMKTDIVPLMLQVAGDSLQEQEIEWREGAAVCVVMASRGYPGIYEKGIEIKGLDKLENKSDVVVFHAGTKQDNDKILTNGGRVLGVTAVGSTISDTIKKVYESVSLIDDGTMYFRNDIGAKAIKRN